MLNKKNVWKIFGVLFFCMIFIFSSVEAGLNNSFDRQFMTSLSGNVFYVGGNGPNNYTSVQDAINDSVDGDTVFVYDDSSPYMENIIINKSIFLIGEDKNNVVLDGDFKDNVITITADDVFVSGFTMVNPHVENDDWDSTQVDIISAENVTVRDNIVHRYENVFGNDNAGIILRNSSYCFIQNNTLITEPDTSRAFGVVLLPDSKFNNISGNEASLFNSGVYLYDEGCTDNVIYMNYLHHNIHGVFIIGDNNTIINNIINFNSCGIWSEDSSNIVIIGNIITDNGEGYDVDDGIGLIGGSNNYISYNHISRNNPYGIDIVSINNYITNNDISNNPIGVYCDNGYYNHITKNNFIKNKMNGYFEVGILDSRNYWYRNYWNRPRLLPYPIFGYLLGVFNAFRWVNFDWHPAQEPYDI